MDEEIENKVILRGSFRSPYSKRIELALTLKSIPYQLVQEDLQNKSQTLLRYNSVHKKIPVLVHNLYDVVIKVVKSEGEEQEKALTEVKENLRVIEKEGLKGIFSDTDGEPTVTNETMSFVDIAMCTLLSPYKAYEEVVGLKIVDRESVPGVYGWLIAINETGVVKDLSHPYEQVLEILSIFRQISLSFLTLISQS